MLKIGEVRLMTFPLVIFLAFVVCIGVYLYNNRYNRFYMQSLFGKLIPMLVCAAIGSRLISAVSLTVSSDDSFFYNLIFGGSVFYGGVLGGMIGLLVACKRKGQSFLDYADVFATLLPLGHAIGRIGCYLNGCCYGREYDGILAVDYMIDGVQKEVFPTWFVEAICCCILFIYFQVFCKVKTRGIRTAIYMITYSLYRFVVEFMRGDKIRGFILGVSTSQIISCIMLVMGVAIWYASEKKAMTNDMIE